MRALGPRIAPPECEETRPGGSVPHRTTEGPRHVSMQAWFLYSLMYILVGDLEEAGPAFCGLADQLSRRVGVLPSSVTEEATLPTTYDNEHMAHTKRLERFIGEQTDCVRLLTDGNSEIKV